jgi:hypothetical protein
MIIYGNMWRLKVYPHSHMDREGQPVSIFVESMTGPGQLGLHNYWVEMQHSGSPSQVEFRDLS